MSKAEKIAQLKADYPVLTKGINEKIVEMDAQEYEATISQWADEELAREAAESEETIKAAAKAALLERLGITADEATLLLS